MELFARLGRMKDMEDLSKLSDAELYESLERLARSERQRLPAILSRLGEIDSRDAQPPKGASLFAYCLKVLRWSEGETWRRIRAARASKRYPKIRLYLGSGRLTMSAVAALEPHLTAENHRELVRKVQSLSSRELDAFLAAMAPRAERRERITPLGPRSSQSPRPPVDSLPLSILVPHSGPQDEAAAAEKEPAAAPGPNRVEYVFTADDGLAKEIEDARALRPAGSRPKPFQAAPAS
jgi:hypothetical protein